PNGGPQDTTTNDTSLILTLIRLAGTLTEAEQQAAARVNGAEAGPAEKTATAAGAEAGGPAPGRGNQEEDGGDQPPEAHQSKAPQAAPLPPPPEAESVHHEVPVVHDHVSAAVAGPAGNPVLSADFAGEWDTAAGPGRVELLPGEPTNSV